MWKSYWEALKYLKKLNRVDIAAASRLKTLIHVSIIAFSQSFPGSVGHECSSRKHVFDNRPYDQQQT
jgi:hypothetical protein